MSKIKKIDNVEFVFKNNLTFLVALSTADTLLLNSTRNTRENTLVFTGDWKGTKFYIEKHELFGPFYQKSLIN